MNNQKQVNNSLRHMKQQQYLNLFLRKQDLLSHDAITYIQSQDIIPANTLANTIQMNQSSLFQCYFRQNDIILIEKDGKMMKISLKELLAQQNIKINNSLKVVYVNSNSLMRYRLKIQPLIFKNPIINKPLYMIRLHYSKNKKMIFSEIIVESDDNSFLQNHFTQTALNVIIDSDKNNKNKNNGQILLNLIEIDKQIQTYKEMKVEIMKIQMKRYEKNEQLLYKMLIQSDDKYQIQPYAIVNDIMIKYKQRKDCLWLIVHIDNSKGNVNLRFVLHRNSISTFIQVKNAVAQYLKSNYNVQNNYNLEQYRFFNEQKQEIKTQQQQLVKYYTQKQTKIFLMKRYKKGLMLKTQKGIQIQSNAVLLDYQHINIKKDKSYQNLQLKNIQIDTIIDSRQFQPQRDVQKLLKASNIKKLNRLQYTDYIKIAYKKISKPEKQTKILILYKHNYVLYSVNKKADHYQCCTILELKNHIENQRFQSYFLFSGSGKTYEIEECVDVVDEFDTQSLQLLNQPCNAQDNIQNEIIIINDIKVLNKRAINHNIRILVSLEQKQNKFDRQLIIDFCYDDIYIESVQSLLQNLVKDFTVNIFHCVLYNNKAFSIQQKIQKIINKQLISDKVAYIFVICLPHLTHDLTNYDISHLQSLTHEKAEEDKLQLYRVKKHLYYSSDNIINEQKGEMQKKRKILYLPSVQDKHSNKISYFCNDPIRRELQQIQACRFKGSKIILWVDDNPQNNRYAIKQIRKDDRQNRMQIIQLQSTQSTLKWINYFYTYLTWLAPNFCLKLITDMKRYEIDEAGADLIEEIVKLGLQIEMFVFTGNQQYSYNIIKERQSLANTRIKISQYEIQLRDWVFKSQFELKRLYQSPKINVNCILM